MPLIYCHYGVDKWLYARVTAVFRIKNPLDEYEIEKIKIYLNKTQTLDYSFDSENVTIEKMKTET